MHSAINIYQRYLDAVIKTLYPLSFTHLFVSFIESAVELKEIKCCKSFYLVTFLLDCDFCHVFNILSLRVQ